MWASPSGCLRLRLVVAVLSAFLQLLRAAEPWTAADDFEAAAACGARGEAARGSCHMAMLQKEVSPSRHIVSEKTAPSHQPSHHAEASALLAKMAPLSVSYVGEGAGLGLTGNAAELDPDGYRKVLQLKSKFQTTTFVNRLVENMNLKVVNEDLYRGYILSLDADADFNGIRWMLENQADEPCGWTQRKDRQIDVDGSSAPLTEDGYMKVLELYNTYEMFLFANRVIEEEGYHMSKHKGKLHGMLSFYNCEKGFQSLSRMRDELREIADSKYGWIKKGEDFTEESGQSAPLTEEGYMAVYDICNTSELYTFARRVIDNEGLIFSGEKGKLQGLLEFYSCEKGIQSLHKLTNELRKIAALPDGWLKIGDGRSLPVINNNNNGNNNNNDDMSDWHNSNDNDNNDGSESRHGNDDSSFSLTEDGYQSVAKLCDKTQLFNFANRLIENEGLRLSGDEGMLNGMLEYYNCDKLQSLENMRAELHRVAQSPDGWVSGRVASGSNEGNQNNENNADAANEANVANENNANNANENNGNEDNQNAANEANGGN